MREICTYGSEGGETGQRSSLPLSTLDCPDLPFTGAAACRTIGCRMADLFVFCMDKIVALWYSLYGAVKFNITYLTSKE